MSTAEQLALALEKLTALVWDKSPSLLSEDFGGNAALAIEIEDALLAYRSAPADGGGQGVTLTDAQIASAWRQWPRQSITSAAKAIEFVRWCGIGTPASTGGEDHA